MALTVRQPFACWIVSGEKKIEYRKWATRYRGPLAIHAAKKADPSATADQPRSAIMGLVDLVDCLPIEQVPNAAPNGPPWPPWCWLLAFPRPLAEPIACSGQLGLWTLPPAVLAAVEAQLAAV